MASRRYHQIDLLRSVACFMVVAFHYLYRGHLDGWIPFVPPMAVTETVKFGYLGVQLFFAISGFVIFLSAQGATPRAFAASRAARLYPAFWAAVALTTLVVHLGGLSSLVVPWRDVFLNLTMVAHWFKAEFVDWAYWSLAVEFHFYIMVWLLLRFDAMKHIKIIMSVWLLMSALNWLRPVYPVEFVLEVRWAPFFSVGICAFLMRQGDRSRWVHALFSIASLLSLAYAYSDAKKALRFDHLDVVAVLLLSCSIPVLFWQISRESFEVSGGRVLYWAATLTYPVYLLHEYIGYVLISRLSAAGVPGMLSALAVFVGVLLLAYLVNTRVERPLSVLIKRWVAGA